MYLHLVDDNKQIIPFILRTNEMFPDQHLFFVISKNNHLKNIPETSNIFHFLPGKKNIQALSKKLTDYQSVFIHNLCLTKARIINQASGRVIFLWSIWGFDYYNVYPVFYRNLFLPYTKIANLILFKYSLTWNHFLSLLQPLLHVAGLKSPNEIRQQAAKKINYSLNMMPEHSDVFKVFQMPLSKRFNFSYYSIEYLTEKIMNSNLELGKYILIGNSSSNSSNHLDIFLQLRKLPIQKIKIIVPLNYGCKRYKKLVNLAGSYLFKKNFIPLNQWLSLSEYHSWLLKCNIMIFNHTRAQALGNILFGVWAGHKIFLRKTNPIYRYLTNMGITVFSIEEELIPEHFNSLSKDLQLLNRQIIEVHYNEDKIRESYLDVINAINLQDKRL